ncbi:hypothetical protein QJ857_gp0643 [Tupanvirus soda lake]|uniref:Uncharacterized protein n=2 Tax=Tupanvirus TaxID=2094720 RepID=A0A6N1NN72_9VIRU|nr:hypothetical protein QJ857_gp0643 [Tupanvirus soda lake]QKU35400.1 hypothetical protein [Tupanvirus soda lake]
MKSIIFFLLIILTVSHAYTKLDKLSTNEALEALELVDKIENSTSDLTNKQNIEEKFFKITGAKYDFFVRRQLYNVISLNNANQGVYSKLVGLISFQNVLLICMVVVGIAFMFSFLHDILFILGAYVGLILYKIFFTKESLYVQGFFISFVTLCFRFDQFENGYIKYFFIFDAQTPLFGCIIFYLVITFVYFDYFSDTHTNFRNQNKDSLFKDIIINFVWMTAAVYHSNKMIGILVIIMLFRMYGFMFGSNFIGYYAGFNRDSGTPQRCFVLSVVLNSIMIMSKIGFVTGNVVAYLNIFETGIYFWATLVGALAMLILSDEYYHKYTYGVQYNNLFYLIMQLIMAIYCLALMFLGNIFYITFYQGIGGTFLVLWALDVERTFLEKFRRGSTTVLLFIILTNLYLIKQYVSRYPEYFIF